MWLHNADMLIVTSRTMGLTVCVWEICRYRATHIMSICMHNNIQAYIQDRNWLSFNSNNILHLNCNICIFHGDLFHSELYWRSLMTMLYWEWHFIPKWPLRSIFARFLEQLLKDLVSRGSLAWWVFLDRSLLGRYFRGYVLSVLEYCSAVWCSAADTHLHLLGRAVSGAQFLTGGVFEYGIALRRSVAVLCMMYKIRCNPMHPHNDALPGPYVPIRVTRRALVPHRYIYAPPCCRTSQYRRTFVLLSVSLWNDLADPLFGGVGLAGFKSRANAFFWSKLLYPYYSLLLFLTFSSFCLWVGIGGLGSSDW